MRRTRRTAAPSAGGGVRARSIDAVQRLVLRRGCCRRCYSFVRGDASFWKGRATCCVIVSVICLRDVCPAGFLVLAACRHLLGRGRCESREERYGQGPRFFVIVA